jgi:glycosyltransferase involved in cell wall biosynthesis
VAVDVIPNGIDPGQWEVKEWMPGVGALRVVTVMRMAPRKRTQPLVRILASALEQLDGNLEAQLVGDGPERAGSERLARQLGVADKIHFAGRLDRSQILDVFAQSDVYIQPSVKESFGIAALEARTAGLPVVARIQSGTTQFIHDGVEGRLATDDQAMASVLVELGRDPAALAKLTEHNRAVEPHEAWPVVLDAVASAYASAQRSCV